MLIIKNARVIDPASGFDQKSHICITDDKITTILPADAALAAGNIPEEDPVIIDAEGLIAAPGLVDVHVHFRDPDRKSTRLNSSHPTTSRMPSSA